MCGEVYGKVPITWCDNRRLVRPRKNASGKREKTKKGKCNDVVHRSYERSLMWCWTDGVMGIGYSRWQSCWWASSSDMLIYPSIFAFPSLSLHCWSTTTHLRSDATTHAHMTIALALSDRSRLFDGHMTYDSHVFTSILSVSNVPPPAVRPITRSRTARSGTFYSFAICLYSCLPFVFNLPVFTFHQKNINTEALTICLYESPPELRFHTYTLHLFCTILHYFASHRTADRKSVV